MNHIYNHIIRPGDNYWLLARLYQTTTQDIMAANPAVNPYYLRVGQNITVPVDASLNHRYRQNDCISQAAVDFKNDMRSLWEEHVAWTRMVIISLTFDLPDVEFVIARLLQNATDMGDMLRRLYGDLAGDRYAELIREHLLIAADLVQAAIAGDEQAAMAAEEKWYENADQIAAFLSSVNRFLPEEAVREMFYTHLDLTKQEAVHMINMDYQKDIEIYDEIEEQARVMADTIADAMIRLYPDMF